MSFTLKVYKTSFTISIFVKQKEIKLNLNNNTNDDDDKNVILCVIFLSIAVYLKKLD